MLDVAELKRMYDEAWDQFGQAPFSFGVYDRRVLFPRAVVVDKVERETGERVSPEMIDDMERDGLFKWLGGAGGDATELGVPLYVPSRIGLFARLEARGWTRDELRDFAEWEEWVIDDCIADDDLRYEDSDTAILARQVRLDIRSLNEELLSRLPAADRPEDWSRTSWDSAVAALSTEDLSAKRHQLEGYLCRVEATDLETASERWQHHIGRAAFCIRFWEESIRSMLVAGDRAQLEAGFSPAIQFAGEHAMMPRPDQLEEFGRVNWERTLQAWRFLADPDRFPLRLPGFVLVGGRVTLDSILTAEDYAKRRDLFNLEEYVALFRTVAGSRRCAHCTKLLNPSADKRKRYCSNGCSQAARQKAYRQRQKQMILRRPRPGSKDRER